jgi:hypothetical protein
MSDHAGIADKGSSDANARREQRRQERQRLTAEWEARLDQFRLLSFEELTQNIETGGEFDQAVAVDAIAEKDDDRVFPLLLDVLEHTEHGRVRNRAAVALYDIGDQRAFEPLLRTIRREYRGRGGVGTLLFALLSLDARGALVDAARILCDGTDETYESAWEAFAVIQHMTSPLPADAYREALTVLKACREAGGHPDWKQPWLEDAIEHVERCGDDRDHPPSDLCSICLQPVAVRGNDPVALDVLPRYWLPRTEDQTLETYVCHEACLLRVLHPDAQAELTHDLTELNALDSL